MAARRAQTAPQASTEMKLEPAFALLALLANTKTRQGKRSARIAVPANFKIYLVKVNVMRAQQASTKAARGRRRVAIATLAPT